MTREVMLNLLRYTLNYYVDSLKDGADGTYDLQSYSYWPSEESIFKTSHICFALATALRSGAFDSSVMGKSSAAAYAINAKLAKSIAKAHAVNGGYKPMNWMSGFWVYMAGAAAWMIWDHLDSVAKTYVVKIVQGEADVYKNRPSYYCGSSYESSGCLIDTRAEEDVEASLLTSLAASMMPNHPDAPAWRTACSRFLVAGFARISDARRNLVVDGKLVGDWMDGWNAFEPGFVCNHGFNHPDYTAMIADNQCALINSSLAGKTAPQAVLFNQDVVYSYFVDYPFPGGKTIYRDDSATVYYPNGTDWCPKRLDLYYQMDVFAHLVPRIDDRVSTPALTWAMLRARYAKKLQARFTTGEVYAAGEWTSTNGSPETNWIQGETQLLWCLSNAYMMLWLDHQKRMAPIGNWRLDLIDTTRASIPGGIAGQPGGPFNVRLFWNRSTDPESGIYGYRIYRDGTDMGITADTCFVDRELTESTSYRYQVAAINGYGWESDSAGFTVRSAVDSVAPEMLFISQSGGSALRIVFDERMDSASACNPANYAWASRTVSAAALSPDRRSIMLSVPGMAIGDSGGMNVRNVRDAAAASNPLSSQTLGFKYDSLSVGILGYWPFDGKEPGVAQDWSGNGNDGAVKGAVACTGKSGFGLRFDGKDMVDMGSIYDSLQPPFTVGFWLRWAGDTSCGLVVSDDIASPQYLGAVVSITKNGLIQGLMGNGGNPDPNSRKSIVSTTAVSRDTWTHVAVVFNSLSVITIYINGQNAGGSMSGSGTRMQTNAVKNFRIGVWSLTTTMGPYYLKGDMDEVRVYSRALSATDVAALAGMSGAGAPAGETAEASASFTARPNPFNPSVRFFLQTGKIGAGFSISIFDLQGRLVRELGTGDRNGHSARVQIVWDGRDNSNQSLSSGVYFAKAVFGNQTRHLRLLLQK